MQEGYLKSFLQINPYLICAGYLSFPDEVTVLSGLTVTT